jgi:hypothetical protein
MVTILFNQVNLYAWVCIPAHCGCFALITPTLDYAVFCQLINVLIAYCWRGMLYHARLILCICVLGYLDFFNHGKQAGTQCSGSLDD